jgi:hypothetical protein
VHVSYIKTFVWSREPCLSTTSTITGTTITRDQ